MASDFGLQEQKKDSLVESSGSKRRKMIVNAIADDFLDESALVNVRNVSPDGITPIKKQYALGHDSSNSF